MQYEPATESHDRSREGANVVDCPKANKCGQKTELSETPFRLEEKRYKLYRYDRRDAKRKPHEETDFTDVVDMRHVERNTEENQKMLRVHRSAEGRRNPVAYTFDGVPGLYLLPKFLPQEDQLHWATAALDQFAESAHFPNNLTTLDGTRNTTGYESGMRWATLGFKYNWTDKTYSREKFAAFPQNLGDLCSSVVDTLQLPLSTKYEAQTAIVNYFPVGTMMMAHQDISEESMEKPLISCSFSCSSIFLMGTDRREDKPHAFLLRSGDIAVFTGPARTAFHSVPRILDDCPDYLHKQEPRLAGLRVNINVRQVYSEHCALPGFDVTEVGLPKRHHSSASGNEEKEGKE